MSIALTEDAMTRSPVMLDADSDAWLADQVGVDRISKSERIRALVALARTDRKVAQRAKDAADTLRRTTAGGPFGSRVNVTFGAEDTDWLDTQFGIDRINRSERVRALVSLARSDIEVGTRAVQTADELRRARRGGGSP